MKICKICGKTKDDDKFSNGLRRCKICMSAVYKIKNDKSKAYRDNYYKLRRKLEPKKKKDSYTQLLDHMKWLKSLKYD